MARKIALITICSIFTLSVILGYRILKRNEIIISAKERVERPDEIEYLSLDSTNFQLGKLTFPAIMVLISSDCEHCRYEVSTFLDNSPSLERYNVLFLSTEKISAIARFKKDMIQQPYPWIHFGKITKENMLKIFGTPVTPQVYIYNDKKVLVKYFRGETKFESISEFL